MVKLGHFDILFGLSRMNFIMERKKDRFKFVMKANSKNFYGSEMIKP